MDLSRLDRRVIFVLMGLAVIIPILFNITTDVEITRDTLDIYNEIEDLESGEFVMISFDFEASSYPEMYPLALATLNHLFKKNLKVIGLALFSEGTAIGYTLLSEVAGRYGKQYGADYIYLGFRPQYVSAILGMGESIIKVFPEDYLKRPVEEYSEFSGLSGYDDLPLVVSIADGSMPIHWADYANARYQQKVAVACAAVMVTAFKPYFESGQLIGPAAGIKGAAEYEKLLKQRGIAHRRLFAQSTTHVFIIVMVIVANLAAFRGRRR